MRPCRRHALEEGLSKEALSQEEKQVGGWGQVEGRGESTRLMHSHMPREPLDACYLYPRGRVIPCLDDNPSHETQALVNP